ASAAALASSCSRTAPRSVPHRSSNYARVVGSSGRPPPAPPDCPAGADAIPSTVPSWLRVLDIHRSCNSPGLEQSGFALALLEAAADAVGFERGLGWRIAVAVSTPQPSHAPWRVTSASDAPLINPAIWPVAIACRPPPGAATTAPAPAPGCARLDWRTCPGSSQSSART